MSKKTIYLDHAAATPLAPEVKKAMEPFWSSSYGNASSLHSLGQEAKKALNESRSRIASTIGAQPDEIVFTSGGTESINLAIKGVVHGARSKKHIIISNIEHQAVLTTAQHLQKIGHSVTFIKADKYGLISVDSVLREIRPNTTLISLIHAQNEIGTVQPIAAIGNAIVGLNRKRKSPIYFHTDACQSAGYLDINVLKLHVDLLSLNGSKIYGSKGVGLLYTKRGLKLTPQIHGGGQQKNLRSGTEDIASIVGLAAALQLTHERRLKESKRLTSLRDLVLKQILTTIPNVRLNGDQAKRLPNNINLSFADIEGGDLVLRLDKAGIATSTGSACSTAEIEPSHIIKALGLPKRYRDGSLRLSLGYDTTKADLEFAIKKIQTIVKSLRK